MFKLAVQAILSKTLKKNILGKEVNEELLQPILKEIRIALLNSDVNLSVVKAFLNDIKEEILINKKFTNNTTELEVEIFKIIKNKLISILSSKNQELILSKNNLNKIMFVGMNGSGKTTSVVKMSYFLKNKKNFLVQNIGLDIYRPAAYKQLEKLSQSIEVQSIEVKKENFFKKINEIIKDTESNKADVLLFDTAGLIPDDPNILDELKKIQKEINPIETIFVLDAMSGQESLNILKNFHDHLNITGLLVSKSDSQAPMGAAFSANFLLNIPIKFLGTGEKPEDLTQFFVDRIVGQILGEGDIMTLAEQIEEKIDKDFAKNSINKIFSGKFDLLDLMNQIREMQKFGSLKKLLGFLPGNKFQNLPVNQIESEFKIWEILINSMTFKEKKNPKLFKKEPNRKNRVIKGSGRSPDELNKLLKRWETGKKKMEEISKKFNKGFNPMSIFH